MISKYILDTLDRVVNGKREVIFPNNIVTEFDVKYHEGDMYDADIFYKKDMKLKGVILNIHGGGFLSGEKKGLREFCLKLAEMGYFIFSINYPLPPISIHPDPIISSLYALDYLSKNSKYYKIDMSNLYITGDSAGAYIALYLALSALNPKLNNRYNFDIKIEPKSIKGLMLYCGIYDFDMAWNTWPKFMFKDIIREYLGLKKNNFLSSSDREYFSPINFIIEGLPKIMVVYAKYDPLRRQSERLINELEKLSVNTSVFYGKRMLSLHDFHLRLKSRDGIDCMKCMQKFINSK